ncbi:MAG: hypothetical protein KF687_03590 [Cyclobacteriaceae bacterium]|nr:hypothetical protein [Cyclobacteriaceae bacterium]
MACAEIVVYFSALFIRWVMWVLVTVLVVLLLLLISFLITPIVLYIDSEKQRYEVYQFPVLKFFIDPGTLKPRLNILGLAVPISSGKGEKKPPFKKNEIHHKEKKSGGIFSKSVHAWRFLIQGAIKSFSVKRLILLLDTDDVVLNAKLTPVCMLATRGPYTLQTNFEGRVYFHLEILNKPGKLLWIFLQFLTKK